MARKYDLEERTGRFGEAVLRLCKSLKPDSIDRIVINQLARSGTSIGANYMEADSCSSKKDFVYNISLCRKEAKETTYWIRLLRQSTNQQEELKEIEEESHQLTLIFSAILKSAKT